MGLAFLVLIAGCGPPWSVIRQAEPSPMVGKRDFTVMPIDFNGLQVGAKTEAGYLAEKDDSSRESWVGDKVGMNDEFARALMETTLKEGIKVGPGTPAEFVIQPKVSWLEPGFYAVVASKPSEVQMTVVISTPDGTVLDEIALSHKTQATMTRPAVGNRLRDDAKALGKYVGRYVAQRVKGEQ